MDGNALNNNSGQVTADEIIQELNKQVGNLNCELIVARLAIKKLQDIIANSVAHKEEPSKIIAETF
jgi:hypothetical protein